MMFWKLKGSYFFFLNYFLNMNYIEEKLKKKRKNF